MTTDDLSILADALTFALLATGAGLVMWAVARATWRRRGLRRTMKVGMSTTALVAVGLAGIAMWPAARDGVNGIPGLGPPQDQTENPSSQDSAPDLVPPSPEVLRTRSGGGPVGTGQSSDPSSSDPSSSDPSSDQATDPSSSRSAVRPAGSRMKTRLPPATGWDRGWAATIQSKVPVVRS